MTSRRCGTLISEVAIAERLSAREGAELDRRPSIKKRTDFDTLRTNSLENPYLALNVSVRREKEAATSRSGDACQCSVDGKKHRRNYLTAVRWARDFLLARHSLVPIISRQQTEKNDPGGA